jgi:hypothetical protein
VDASFILSLQTSLLLAGASVVTPAVDAGGDRITHLLGNGLSNHEIAGVLNFTDFTPKRTCEDLTLYQGLGHSRREERIVSSFFSRAAR